MRVLALLLALTAPAVAAERVAVPRTATTAQLKAALDKCKLASPKGDRCFNLQLALSAAMLHDGDAEAAQKLADTARSDVQDTWSDADDVYVLADSRARRPEATAAEKAASARATAEWRRLWVDQAIASEAEGDAWVARGWHHHAMTAFSRAASIRKSYGSGDANRDAQLRAAARAAVAQGGVENMVEGEKALRPILAEAERIHGAAHPLVAAIRLDLADMLAVQSKTKEAETLYAQSRATLRGDAAVDADGRYVRFLIRADRKREAEPLARDVLARLLAVRTDKARIATAYLDLAAIVPLADALPLARQAVALRVARFGDKNLETARANIVLARLLERADRYPEAEKLRRPALIAIQAAQYIRHPETATAYMELGENIFLQQQGKDASYFFRTAMEGYSDSLGVDHPSTARATLFLALAAIRTGSEDPGPLIKRALPVIRKAFAPAHMERLQAEFIYTTILYYRDRDLSGALRQIRGVSAAALERARTYPEYNTAAQFEMRQLAPIFAVQVRLTWEASQRPAAR